jgi:hypothetical protein
MASLFAITVFGLTIIWMAQKRREKDVQLRPIRIRKQHRGIKS